VGRAEASVARLFSGAVQTNANRLPNATAKVKIPAGCTWRQVADQLNTIGVTLDAHQLPDGTYRAYVRKDRIQRFLTAVMS